MTAEKLRQRGLHTVGDIAELAAPTLEAILGRFSPLVEPGAIDLVRLAEKQAEAITAAAEQGAAESGAEAERVLGAAGLSVTTAEEDRERRGTLLQRRSDLERRGGSTWQSLTRGNGSVESDYLNGEIVLTGRLMSGQPNAGVGFELDAIAAAARFLERMTPAEATASGAATRGRSPGAAATTAGRPTATRSG